MGRLGNNRNRASPGQDSAYPAYQIRWSAFLGAAGRSTLGYISPRSCEGPTGTKARMGQLKEMPPVALDQARLAEWGQVWLGTVGSPVRPKKKADLPVPKAKQAKCFDKKQGMDFGMVFDAAYGAALSTMLGNTVAKPNDNSLLPPAPDVVEVGKTRVVGGIRPPTNELSRRAARDRVWRVRRHSHQRPTHDRPLQQALAQLPDKRTFTALAATRPVGGKNGSHSQWHRRTPLPSARAPSAPILT